MSNKSLGIFIPLDIIHNQELDWINKILLSEIISLTKLEKGCIASNQYLADFLQIQKSSLHRRIKFLVENDYIKTKNVYSGKKCVGRVITHTGKLMVAPATTKVAHATNVVAQATIKGSTRYHTMVAESDPRNTFSNSGNTDYNSVINTEEDLELQMKQVFSKFNIN